MYKLILSLLIISFISMTYGQAIQTGTYTYMQQISSASCSSKVGANQTLTQNSNGYQLYTTKGAERLVNITVNRDSTLQGLATLWYPAGGFAGYTQVKGVAYSQYSFQAVLLPTNSFNGATYFYSFTNCPTPRLGETEQDHFETSHDLN